MLDSNVLKKVEVLVLVGVYFASRFVWATFLQLYERLFIFGERPEKYLI
jgi:hypothetical protein